MRKYPGAVFTADQLVISVHGTRNKHVLFHSFYLRVYATLTLNSAPYNLLFILSILVIQERRLLTIEFYYEFFFTLPFTLVG